MTERLSGFTPEVRLVANEITDEWLTEFNQDFAADEVVDESTGSLELAATHAATVATEQWFEQSVPYEASSYFNLIDRMGPSGWMQQIQGKVYQADRVYMPSVVGGEKNAVLALYDAGVVMPGGEIIPLVNA